MPAPSPAPASAEGLLERAARLERELQELERQLTAVAAGTPRSGLHLVVEVAGVSALIEARAVVQITRLVEFTPIPGAPEAVLGGFVRQGDPGVAIDLARVLGSAREPAIDAHLVIVGGARMLGILVDHVRHVIEAPTRVDPRAEKLLPSFREELVAGWCEVGGWLLPLVTVEAVERLATRPADGEEPRRRSTGEGEST